MQNFHKTITIGCICFALCGVISLNGTIMYQNSFVQSQYQVKKTKKMDNTCTVKTQILTINLNIALSWKALSYFKVEEM